LFRRIALALAAIVGALILVAPRHAYAQDKTLSGRWAATAMSVQWSIGDWGEACGPKPGGGGAPAGTVTVQQRGGELSMSGAGRSYSTTQCWEQFPGLSPVSHSGGKRGWNTVCKTPPGDPRQATVRTSLNASDDFIGLNETGQYQFVIKGQNCTASVRRTRTFKLIQREGEAAPAPAPSAPVPSAPPPKPAPLPEPKPKPTATESRTRCGELGAPARLEVRPSRKLMRPGEEFEFQARVLDAAGCVLPTKPSFELGGAPRGVSVSGRGKVRILEDAPDGEVSIRVSVAGKSVDVVVEVASSGRYDALLQGGGFNEAGESENVAVTAIASGSIGAGSASVDDRSNRHRRLFVAIVGGLAFLLGAVGVLLVLRGKKRRPDPAPASSAPAAPRAAPPAPAPGARFCPTCREEFPPDAQFCPNDGNRLIAAPEAGDPRAPAGGICPVCGQGFDPGIVTCPTHDEELVPPAVYFAGRESEPRIDRKICPVCGAQYTGQIGFCGTDGAALVPVN
jgi:hypothetical protein